MRICAISPFEQATKKEISTFLSNCNHDLLLLPGNSENHPTYVKVGKSLKPGMYAFVESGGSKGNLVPRLVSKTHILEMPGQVFERSPSSYDLDTLQSRWPERTYKITNRSVSFAICGEIDAFNIYGEVKRGRHLPFDILVNPTHTIRGRWNHLGRKLEALSRNTVVAHVANNTFNHSQTSTCVRIYVDGKIMKREQTGNIIWSECEI
jgi:hypothetical protein